MEARGAWVTLATIACAAEPRGAFRDRAHAELLLSREGAENPAGLVRQLVDARLLDEDDEGLRFHDWTDWQRKPSDMPDAVAERVRRHRGKGASETPAGVTSAVTPQKDGREESAKERSTPDGAPSGRASVVVDEETRAEILAMFPADERPLTDEQRSAVLDYQELLLPVLSDPSPDPVQLEWATGAAQLLVDLYPGELAIAKRLRLPSLELVAPR
jgi:hypothetical protein